MFDVAFLFVVVLLVCRACKSLFWIVVVAVLLLL